MLRKKDVEWVKSRHTLHREKPKKSMSNYERQRYYRLRPRIKETLEALTTLIENLPEAQLEQTFNKNNMAPFLKALFSLKTDDLKKRRKRVIELWDFMLVGSGFSGYSYGNDLVGRDVMRVLTSGVPNTIKAIYYATCLK